MLRLAYRHLRAGGLRTVLTVAGIAAVVGVILVLEGFEQGIYRQLRSTVHDRGGDLIAAQSGVSNMIAARSVIPQTCRDHVESVPGVRAAHPLTALPVVYDKEGRRTPLFLLVHDGPGGPARLRSGTPAEGDREIVVDHSFADKYGLAPGDELTLADYRFEVSGISDGAVAFFTPLAFIDFDTLIDFYFESNLAEDISAFPLLSYLLVDLEPDADPARVAAAIEREVPDIDVMRPETIAANDARMGETMFGSILGMLIAIGYAAGALVVGLFMFAASEARTRELGVLKAIGFTNGGLLRAIVAEAFMLTALTLPFGVLLAELIAAVVHWAAPSYLIATGEPGSLLRTFAACAVFTFVGALAPLRLIRDLEPAAVFRS